MIKYCFVVQTLTEISQYSFEYNTKICSVKPSLKQMFSRSGSAKIESSGPPLRRNQATQLLDKTSDDGSYEPPPLPRSGLISKESSSEDDSKHDMSAKMVDDKGYALLMHETTDKSSTLPRSHLSNLSKFETKQQLQATPSDPHNLRRSQRRIMSHQDITRV